MKALFFLVLMFLSYFVGTMLLGLGGLELSFASAWVEVVANTVAGFAALGAVGSGCCLVKPSADAHARP